MISVILADDHAMVRQGLRAFLETVAEIEVIGEASDGLAALELLRETRPDVAIVDVNMPGMSGVDLVRQAAEVAPDTAILILSMHGDPAVVAEVLEAGARGYVLKETDAEHLLEAIVQVAAGMAPVLGPNVMKPLEDDLEPLTAREREVVTLIARGISNRDVAMQLAISVRTVEAHRASVMRKLHLHSPAEMTLYAVGRGLIPPRRS